MATGMNPNMYTVKKGDTLSGIASKYLAAYNKSNGTNLTTYKYVDKLVDINDLDDANFIMTGEVLKLEGAKPAAKKNLSYTATIKRFGLQNNSDNTVFATWSFDHDNLDHYEIKWTYTTGDGVQFIGTEENTTNKQSTYSFPANATKAIFKVKPVAKKKKDKKGKETKTRYWTGKWSAEKTYYVTHPPAVPPVPTLTVKDYKLTMSVSNTEITGKGKYIEFKVVKNDKTTIANQTVDIRTNAASYTLAVDAGAEYKVCCRAIEGDLESDWSDYSANVHSGPAASKGIKTVKALSKTSVSIDWYNVSSADSYDIEYTTQKRYFDSSNEVQSMSVTSVVGHAEVTGLTSGSEYFFRVRAVKGDQKSAWTDIKSIILGEPPGLPTTWSTTTTAIVGEPLNLYWMHNTADGSKWTKAELELTVGGVVTTINNFKNTTAEDEGDEASMYSINTSIYTEGTSISWRVRTAGITGEWSDWSIMRTIDIYAKPTVELVLPTTVLTSFPFTITASAGPITQKPIGYHVAITSTVIYDTVDELGNTMIINKGEAVYEKYFDTTEPLLLTLGAGDVNLDNNITYKVTCTVSMNSGLTAESSRTFKVTWEDIECYPNAEVGIDSEGLTASIYPFCLNADGAIMQNVSLSVYRREYNGTFTEIQTGIVPGTTITDPHPSLDYARYRIVAIIPATGAVSYYDMPGIPVDETSVVIQWAEKWSVFDINSDDPLEQPPWSGSWVKLPYNIDVSEKPTKDVELVEYIGRRHPVSYYGTQVGETTTWNVTIEKDDEETIYALRRLAIYIGDVYVREPSGVGYWATINVSFSQTHNELIIPVTLDITRVEGGM